MRTNVQARRFLAAIAAGLGGIKPLSRKIDRSHQTTQRIIEGKPVLAATAADFHGVLRRLGFVGETGLEPVTLPMAPPDDSTPPEAA